MTRSEGAIVAVDPAMQRDGGDCALAALAMIGGRPYREIAEVAIGMYPTVLSRGLWTPQIVRVARKAGIRLRKQVREDDSTGLLLVSRRGWGHAVALFQGVIINPADGLLWDVETFLVHAKVKRERFFEVLE